MLIIKTSYTKIIQIQNGQKTSKAISPKMTSKWLIKWQYCEKIDFIYFSFFKEKLTKLISIKVWFNDSIYKNIIKIICIIKLIYLSPHIVITLPNFQGKFYTFRESIDMVIFANCHKNACLRSHKNFPRKFGIRHFCIHFNNISDV